MMSLLNHCHGECLSLKNVEWIVNTSIKLIKENWLKGAQFAEKLVILHTKH